MDLKYTDAWKLSVRQSRREAYNKWKTVLINYQTPPPADVQARADAIFATFERQLGPKKLGQKRIEWRAMYWALETAAQHQWASVMFPRNKNHPDFTSTRCQVIDAARMQNLVVEIRSPPGAPKMTPFPLNSISKGSMPGRCITASGLVMRAIHTNSGQRRHRRCV